MYDKECRDAGAGKGRYVVPINKRHCVLVIVFSRPCYLLRGAVLAAVFCFEVLLFFALFFCLFLGVLLAFFKIREVEEVVFVFFVRVAHFCDSLISSLFINKGIAALWQEVRGMCGFLVVSIIFWYVHVLL